MSRARFRRYVADVRSLLRKRLSTQKHTAEEEQAGGCRLRHLDKGQRVQRPACVMANTAYMLRIAELYEGGISRGEVGENKVRPGKGSIFERRSRHILKDNGQATCGVESYAGDLSVKIQRVEIE